MAVYMKRPIVVEAFQMTQERRLSNSDWPGWMNEAWQAERGTPNSLYPTVKGTGEGTLSIGHVDGEELIDWGKWIIRTVSGSLHACPPDLFELAYVGVGLAPEDVSEAGQ